MIKDIVSWISGLFLVSQNVQIQFTFKTILEHFSKKLCRNIRIGMIERGRKLKIKNFGDPNMDKVVPKWFVNWAVVKVNLHVNGVEERNWRQAA